MTAAMTAAQMLSLALLMLVHVLAGRLQFLDAIPRSKWLSFAGGVSVAFVFVHILPGLHSAQRRMERDWDALPWIEQHAYLLALIGLAVFYGLERIVKASRREPQDRDADETRVHAAVFWLHVGSFGLYNALVGYLIVQPDGSYGRGLLYFAFAMALHFLANDYGLRQEHRRTYRHRGRWVLVVAVLVGGLTGLAIELDAAAIDVLYAFLAGALVLNVLKEELPEERQSRFGPFAAGAAGYSALLLLG